MSIQAAEKQRPPWAGTASRMRRAEQRALTGSVACREGLDSGAQGFSSFHRLVMRIWELEERSFARKYSLRPVPGDENGILRLSVQPHRGRAIQLQDGTRIEPGDKIAELHLDNNRVASLYAKAGPSATESTVALGVARLVARGLMATAAALQRGRLDPEIKALFGRSFFHKGAERLGFEVFEIPSRIMRWFLMFFERWLMVMYHPQGLRRLFHGRAGLSPREVWLSRSRLLELYGNRSHGRKEYSAVQEASL